MRSGGNTGKSFTNPAPAGGGLNAPVFTAAAGQTLIYAGDSSDSHYASLTTAGDAAGGSSLRFVPSPSPYYDSNPTSPTTTNITTGKGGVGKALQNIYPVSAGQPGDDWNLVNVASMAGVGRAIFLRYKVRYTGNARSSGPIAAKHVRFTAPNGPAGGNLPQWSIGGSGYSGDQHISSDLAFYDNGFTSSDQANQPFGPYPIDLIGDGLWHQVVIAYKIHTSTSNRDGFSKFWMDDKLIIWNQQTSVGVTPAGGVKPWTAQDMIDNGLANLVDSGAPFLSFGGVSFRAVTDQWGFDTNLGDGDATHDDTLAVWWEAA